MTTVTGSIAGDASHRGAVLHGLLNNRDFEFEAMSAMALRACSGGDRSIHCVHDVDCGYKPGVSHHSNHAATISSRPDGDGKTLTK